MKPMKTNSRDEAWREQALCRRFPNQLDRWFPSYETPKQTADARGVCSWCPVKDECLDFALSLTGPHRPKGVWGGTTTRERARIRTQRTAQTTAA